MVLAAQPNRLDNLRSKLRLRNPLVVNAISELFGTALFILFGLGIVFTLVLGKEKLNTWIQVNIGWAFALVVTVHLCAHTSGGQFNPAVSFMLYLFGKLSLVETVVYSVAQTIGAFIAAATAYLVYYDQINFHIGSTRAVSGKEASAILFCSYAPEHLSNTGAFIDQVVGTALLCLFVAAIIDKRNRIPDYLHPLLFGLTLMTVGMSFGMNLGYPINPARDLGPRIFAYLAGYGSEVFTHHNNYSWIPVVAPFFGAALGGALYQLLVGFHLPEKPTETRVVLLNKEGKESELQPLNP